MTHTREEITALVEAYIESEALRNHSRMVAKAMESYAISLSKPQEEVDKWWAVGMLHDIDWEKFPDDHPNRAIIEILPEAGFEQDIIDAVAAHAPERTGKFPETEMERYIFACDELSGFLNAAKLIRPDGFTGMEVKSVKKKLKDKNFAANVSREDIQKGAELIGKTIEEHIEFLIQVFSK